MHISSMQQARSLRASRSKGIPKEISDFRSCQGLMSLPRSETTRTPSRRSKKPVHLQDLMPQLDMHVQERSPEIPDESRKKLGRFYSTMPVLKPERLPSSEDVFEDSLTANAVFSNAEPYKKKLNMFESFDVSPTCILDLSEPGEDPALFSPISLSIASSIEMSSMRDMLPTINRACSSPVNRFSSPLELSKPLQRPSMRTLMETSMGASIGTFMEASIPSMMQHQEGSQRPVRIAPIQRSGEKSSPFDKTEAAMPLRQPMRKASMDTSITLTPPLRKASLSSVSSSGGTSSPPQ